MANEQEENGIRHGDAPVGAIPTQLISFRYGEAALLFKKFQGGARNDDLDPDLLRKVIQENVRLSETGDLLKLSEFDPFLSRNGRDVRQPIALEVSANEEDGYLFQTINLEHWEPELDERYHRDPTNFGPRFEQALRDVPKAIDALNRHRHLVTVGNWQLLSATPTWLATVFQVIDAGGPGGLPMPLAQAKQFQSQEVLETEEHLGGSLPEGARRPVHIAILDTWPMYPDATVGWGKNPNDPFSKIKDFIDNHPAASHNALLVMAKDGDLVSKDRIFDYVSSEPPVEIPVVHRNPMNGSYEPGYDQSSHGLFIAGIIKEIAPNAELSLYRVLADDGSGDLRAVVCALQDAIRHAKQRGELLVINMSLGFAPPLHAVERLLDISNNAEAAIRYMNPDNWTTLMEESSRPDEQYPQAIEDYARPHESPIRGEEMPVWLTERNTNWNGQPTADAEELARKGLVTLDEDGFIAALSGPIELIDYLFKLPSRTGVLVVAAAGNDSYRDAAGVWHRFIPRLPAFVDGVLGVSARDADFSNRNDVEDPRNDGVTAVSGTSRHDAASSTWQTHDDGLVGLSILEELPPIGNPKTPNDAGLVRWCGTSFATPVVSVLAANLWRRNRDLTADDLIQAICGSSPLVDRTIDLTQR